MKYVSSGPLRPTSAKVREALFAILSPRMNGARFLDLYAGVGSVGLEAWRQGAQRVVMVEKVASTMRILRDNIRSEKAMEETVAMQKDAVAAVRGLSEVFDVVFLDPPYGGDEVRRCLEAVACSALVAPTGVVIAEHHHKDAVPDRMSGWHRFRVQKYGETVLSFYQQDEAPSS